MLKTPDFEWNLPRKDGKTPVIPSFRAVLPPFVAKNAAPRPTLSSGVEEYKFFLLFRIVFRFFGIFGFGADTQVLSTFWAEVETHPPFA